MKKNRSVLSAVRRTGAVLIVSLTLMVTAFQAAHASPEDGSSQPETAEGLDRGDVFTSCGYLKKGVWAKMEGVIEAPPALVWQFFLQADEWKKYGLANLSDSRSVSEDIAVRSRELKKVEDVYAILGKRGFDGSQNRRRNGTWTNYTFQYLNLPWPLSDRWMVLKNVNDEREAAKGIYRQESEKSSGNINTMNGKVFLEPFRGDKNRTRLELYVESDPGLSIPKFMLKWGIKKSMPAAIKIIRREAARAQAGPFSAQEAAEHPVPVHATE